MGVPTSEGKGDNMAVKVSINGKEFMLTWEEFGKVLYRAQTCREVFALLEVKEAMNPESSDR